jgi:LAS superfamily LD-carboxypeptidase LdcB
VEASANKETVSDSIAKSFPKPNFPNDSLLINHLLGKFDYSKDSFFTSVAAEHCSKPMYLQKETYKKFKEMYAAAKKDGIALKIISGTRNFNEQKAIWERKWNTNIKTMDSLKAAKTILLYSSMPTTSRHHWGTDMDINSLENSYFAAGQGLKEYNWLKKNASKYGFCQVYTDKKTTDRTGYEMEKWHWSYIPISSHYLKKYGELITYKQVKGFQASELAPKLKSVEDYVNGIDKSCH